MSFLKDYDHLKIQMKDILSATNNFDSAKVIGGGGFGRVYKGELSLPEGPIMVAFKKLDRRLGQGNIEFWKEVVMLSKCKHENLISLMYYCIEGDEMILGYEYASRGSLDRYLSDASLTWTHRLKICVGAARGLNYLHDPRGEQQRVLHRDIKSGNILLDENWMAKVSDFGLSKVGPANQAQTVLVSNAVGTLGYCDPLYWEMGFLSKESDVYSFGVVLFEILCGRLCCEYNKKGELISIVVPKWRRCYEEKALDEIIFPGLKEQMDPGSLDAFSVIAYQCVKKAQEERPMMAEVVKKLEFALQQQDIFEVYSNKVDFETLIKIADDAKDKKPLDRSSLGVSETKGHASNFSTIFEQEGLFLLQPGDQEPPNMNLDFDFQPLYSNFVPEFMDADKEESSNQGGGGQRRLWVKERSKGWWEYHNSDECPDDEFKEAFRMSKATFNMICDQLDSVVTKKDTMLRMAIPVRQRVAVCLYRLATGDPLRAVSSKFGLGISTCHKLVLEVCAVIRTILMPEYLQWPNKERLEQIKTEYGSISGIPNICGSMYTTHVSIIAPKVSPAAYFNKKHTLRNQKQSYSTTVQGVVDPRGVFTDICMGHPGLLRDGKILERSALWQRFNMGYTKNTWVVGNSGYPLLNWLLVPYSHQNLTSSQHLYNEKLGDVQNIAKDAFMRLKGRWVCLQKRTEVKLQDLPVVVGACCVLHNICEMNNETMDDNLKFDLFDDEISLGEGGSGNSVNAVQVRDSIAHNLLHHSR